MNSDSVIVLDCVCDNAVELDFHKVHVSVVLGLTFFLGSFEFFQPFSQVFYRVFICCANVHSPLRGNKPEMEIITFLFWK